MGEPEGREGGESSGDKGNDAHTAGKKIQDRDDRKQWAEEGHQCLTMKAALFYTDDEVVASTDPGWLHSVFGFLTGMFDRVGLQKNFRKTVGMVCRPCPEAGVRSDESYNRRMTGYGINFKEQYREEVSCP